MNMESFMKLAYKEELYDGIVVNNGEPKRTKRGNGRALVRGQWTPEEDNLLVKLVKEYGVRKWSLISQKLFGRIGKQCRERWHNHLRPGIKKETWSEEEERSLIEVHKQVGNRWSEIAKRIPGRSENSIKNYWNATKRRLTAKRKRTKRKPSSPLQDYILNSTAEHQTAGPPPPDLDLSFLDAPFPYLMDAQDFAVEGMMTDFPLGFGGGDMDLLEMILSYSSSSHDCSL